MTEILFIGFVAFLLFGTKKLPEVAKGLGKGYREFQRAADQIKEEINKVTDDVKKEMDMNETKPKPEEQNSKKTTDTL
jgi:sec-independent protein translocase protein TatA